MAACDDCGGSRFDPVPGHGQALLACTLCGALRGDEALVQRVLLEREAVDRGIDPRVYPLVRSLAKIEGIAVADSDGGDAATRRWPFVQLAAAGPAALRGIENLVKSLLLSAREHEVHWIVEAEFRHRLVFALKPRFHRPVDAIDAAAIEKAQRDLDRIRRHAERDMNLSWWRA